MIVVAVDVEAGLSCRVEAQKRAGEAVAVAGGGTAEAVDVV